MNVSLPFESVILEEGRENENLQVILAQLEQLMKGFDKEVSRSAFSPDANRVGAFLLPSEQLDLMKENLVTPPKSYLVWSPYRVATFSSFSWPAAVPLSLTKFQPEETAAVSKWLTDFASAMKERCERHSSLSQLCYVSLVVGAIESVMRSSVFSITAIKYSGVVGLGVYWHQAIAFQFPSAPATAFSLVIFVRDSSSYTHFTM